jgi:hypothetical protein
MTTCATCRYWTDKMSAVSALKPADGVGECRRHAPRGPVSLGWTHTSGDEVHRAVMSAFPFTPHDDWCGEHKLRDTLTTEVVA